MKRSVCCLLSCLLLCFGCGQPQTPSIRIFVTSDIEGVFWSRPEPRYGNEITGGLSVLKAFLDKQTEPFLLLEGGNWFAQTPEGTLSQGDYFNTVAATLPYAARLFTEKDMLYGWGSLSHIIKNSPAPFVLSNVTLANQRIPAGIKSWLLKDINEYKIGILGLLNQQAVRNKQRVSGLRVTDEITTARQTVQLLREKGAQIVILLSALGDPVRKKALTDTELAEEVPGIDIIIASNKAQENAEVNQVGKTWIIYPGSRLDSIGSISLFFNKSLELTDVQFQDIILYKRDFGEDIHIAGQIEQVRHVARSQMSRPVGKSEQELQGDLEAESVLGNWTADCLRKWAKTDAAIVNASSLRDVLPAGTVTQYDLYKLYPYSDNVTYLTMKGAALLNALEEGLKVSDNFAQISGLRIQYRPDLKDGKKIRSVFINDKLLNPLATYRVAVTDHILAGGAGHDGFIDSLEFKNTHVEMRTVLRLCLAGNKTVAAPATGRWSIAQ